MHESATAKRAFEMLNETNQKLNLDLATKDTIIEGKAIEIGIFIFSRPVLVYYKASIIYV
jgi:hypothetical protein